MTARATRPREWVIAVLGGLALSGVLVWVLRGGETVPDPAPVAVAAPPMVVAPMVVPAPAPLTAAMPGAAADIGEYRLRGVLARAGGGGSAIIEAADGRQRLVREGREVAPGVKLEAVRGDGVVLARGGSRVNRRLPAAAGGGAADLGEGRFAAGGRVADRERQPGDERRACDRS